MDADYKKIIIVDDNETYRTGLREYINRHGQFRVVAEAECGWKGIEAIKQVPADLVILDLSLPRFSGFEVLKKIREISEIKVLILSIYESKEMVKEAFDLGAQGYCVKDISSKELMKAISETIEGKAYVCHKADMEVIFSDKN